VISVVAIAIFSAYILYDVQQIVNGGETNYIRATLASIWTCTTSSPTCCRCWASSAAPRLSVRTPTKSRPRAGFFARSR
jgi:hypothetical protein